MKKKCNYQMAKSKRRRYYKVIYIKQYKKKYIKIYLIYELEIKWNIQYMNFEGVCTFFCHSPSPLSFQSYNFLISFQNDFCVPQRTWFYADKKGYLTPLKTILIWYDLILINLKMNFVTFSRWDCYRNVKFSQTCYNLFFLPFPACMGLYCLFIPLNMMPSCCLPFVKLIYSVCFIIL